MTGVVLVSFSIYNVFEGDFFQGSNIQPKFEMEKKVPEWARLVMVGGGHTGVLELHCIHFLLSFWKVVSHSEAISRLLM